MRCKICKKTTRHPSVPFQETRMCSDCRLLYPSKAYQLSENKKTGNSLKYTTSKEKIPEDEVYVGKSQAKILKNLAYFMPGYNVFKVFDNFYSVIHATDLEFVLEDNWGDLRSFHEYAQNFDNPNQISLILEFYFLEKKLGHIPSQNEFHSHKNFDTTFFSKHFESWEHFADRLGIDYNIKVKKSKITKIPKEKSVQDSSKENDFKNMTPNEIIEKINVDLIDKFQNNPYDLTSFKLIQDRINLISKNDIADLLKELN